MDWDNLRFFLEVARTGTLTAAARRLGVDHTTVARRLRALEKQAGATLFIREADGHRLTEAGRALLPGVQAMEQSARQLAPAQPDAAGGPSGVVRLGVTEGFGTVMLAPQLARLTMQHPSLTLDLLALPRMVHLSRREADIVISLERPQRDSVVVTRLTDYALHLYGEREYLARRPLVRSREDLRHHAFISYVDDLLFTRELQFLGALHQPARQPAHFSLRSTSITAQVEAVRAGAGLAVLPAFLADHDPTLRRVLPTEGRFIRTFWMSMPSELRHESAMQAVWTLVREAVAGMQARLLPP
ncbi:LysR family transcriptional regulator [Ottowia sp.]|uniref:LysR family transcriptional regulator n=1 Tax=Ottowia sp. TaxID=1898956 RepID=UPI003A854610